MGEIWVFSGGCPGRLSADVPVGMDVEVELLAFELGAPNGSDHRLGVRRAGQLQRDQSVATQELIDRSEVVPEDGSTGGPGVDLAIDDDDASRFPRFE